jgi:catechol 2,3-dioxygenase-like lactoylglutathione lyase family enzyme
MKRTWTIIGVSDVPASFKWYQSLFGQPATAPAHPYFGQLLDSDGTVLLCLHEWGAHDHPSLKGPQHATPGNGLLLFFRVDDFDLALQRARALVPRLEEEPQVNPNTGTPEFSLRDPDGYYVTLSALESGPKRSTRARRQPGSKGTKRGRARTRAVKRRRMRSDQWKTPRA